MTKPASDPEGQINAATTVDELAGLWLASLAPTRTETTMRLYEHMRTMHILPALGEMTVEEATTARLGVYLARIQRTRPALARNTRKVLIGMFALAVQGGALKDNPAKDIQLAPIKRPPRIRNHHRPTQQD